MNHTSPEHSAYGEPVSLKINIGKKSFELNAAHKRNGDNDNESGLIDTDAPFEEGDVLVDLEQEPTSREQATSAIAAAPEIPRWDSELESEDNSVEDGAFMISAESVRQFAIQYPGGYMVFERDFQTKWVNAIQDPFGNEYKKKGKNKMDAFMQFSHVSVAEFNEVAKLPDIQIEEYLNEHHIDPDDFENWRLVLEFWENSDELAFDEETLFGDVARGAFIAKLQKDNLALKEAA